MTKIPTIFVPQSHFFREYNVKSSTCHVTLLDRIAEEFDGSSTKMLSIQYRMNSDIARYSSHTFYDSMLVADKEGVLRYDKISNI